jgi:hypothetical protein
MRHAATYDTGRVTWRDDDVEVQRMVSGLGAGRVKGPRLRTHTGVHRSLAVARQPHVRQLGIHVEGQHGTTQRPHTDKGSRGRTGVHHERPQTQLRMPLRSVPACVTCGRRGARWPGRPWAWAWPRAAETEHLCQMTQDRGSGGPLRGIGPRRPSVISRRATGPSVRPLAGWIVAWACLLLCQ